MGWEQGGRGSVWLDLQTLTATWLYGVVNETESCNLQLHRLSFCDWAVNWSVQSLETTVLTPNFFCVMSLCLSRIAHMELEELILANYVGC